MKVETRFPAGLRVEAIVRGHRVQTDQPLAAGGSDAAVQPFELFLASLATCGGFYAVAFCKKRGIPTEGLKVVVDAEKNPETRRLDEIRIDVELPDGFPEKYRDALLRAVDQCAVKRALDDPPAIATRLVQPHLAA